MAPLTKTQTAYFLPRTGASLSWQQAWRRRLKARWQPRLMLDNQAAAWILASGYLMAGGLTRQPQRKLELLSQATRRARTPALQGLAGRMLRPWLTPDRAETWRRYRVGWPRYEGNFGDITREQALKTSLLLKEPGDNGEKGVLYCSFEYNWMKLITHPNARRIFRDFYLVGASSWSPGDHAVLGNLAGLSDSPAFIGISNPADLQQYRPYTPAVHPLPIMACDWLDPRDFAPRPHNERTIDLLLVAHTASWKRHWLLFQALKQMPRDLRVVLIGRTVVRSAEELMHEARAFGVPQDLEFQSHLEIEEVMRYQSNAKVSLALSKREGSCVSVTEAMFADSPVGVMEDAHIGAKAYINEETGRILRPSTMARDLDEMIERSGDFSPRAWAERHIAAPVTSCKLNDILKRHSLAQGLPWTRDITPLCWRYVPRYLDPRDKERMQTGIQRLRDEYGVELEEFVSERQAMRKG